MPETHYRRQPGILLREIDGELLLLNSATDSYYGLNAAGAAMYQSLVDGASVDETIGRVCQEFEVDEATVSNDLSSLLSDLLAKGLLEEVSS